MERTGGELGWTLLVFLHRDLKKFRKETVTFELRPQRYGRTSSGDIWGRGVLGRGHHQFKDLVAEGKMVCHRRAGRPAGEQEGRRKEVKPKGPCRTRQSRIQHTAVRTGRGHQGPGTAPRAEWMYALSFISSGFGSQMQNVTV